MWLFAISFRLYVCGYLSGQDFAMECAVGRVEGDRNK
jgi:hypothetical protein